MSATIPQEAIAQANGRVTQAWQRFFQTIITSGAGSVTSVSITPANGVSGTVSTPSTTPAISLALGAITPTSVAATGTVTGSNLSGSNTGDQFTAETAGTLIGRTSAGAGPAQEITVGTGLAMSGSTLSAGTSYSPGSFTLATETGMTLVLTMKLTGTQQVSLVGTSRLVIAG